MTHLKNTLQADWGLPIEQAVRQLVPALVAVYAAGWWLGAQVHAMNDWLAGRRRPVLPPAPEPDPLVLDVRALSNAGLGRRKIARQLQISESRVRSILRTQK